MDPIKLRAGFINPKVDWLTVIFTDMSLVDCFRVFGVDQAFYADYEDVFAHRYDLSKGWCTKVVLMWHHINIQISRTDLLDFDFDDSESSKRFFDLKFSNIRFDVSATAIDDLKQLGYDIDKHIFEPLFTNDDGSPSDSYHITRCDIAYDLVNYNADFVYRLAELLRTCGNREDKWGDFRVPVLGACQPLKFSVCYGRERCCYLGATGSNRLLRVYDKLFEWQSKNLSLIKCPYYDVLGGAVPTSWIRIELQLRRPDFIHPVLYSDSDFYKVFRYIYDNFAIVEGRGLRPDLRVSQVWRDLFDWSQIPNLVLKSNLVQSTDVDPVVKLHRWIAINAKSLLQYFCVFGSSGIRLSALYLDLAKYIYLLASSESVVDQLRYNSLRRACLDCCVSADIVNDLFADLISAGAKLYFRA